MIFLGASRAWIGAVRSRCSCILWSEGAQRSLRPNFFHWGDAFDEWKARSYLIQTASSFVSAGMMMALSSPDLLACAAATGVQSTARLSATLGFGQVWKIKLSLFLTGESRLRPPWRVGGDKSIHKILFLAHEFAGNMNIFAISGFRDARLSGRETRPKKQMPIKESQSVLGAGLFARQTRDYVGIVLVMAKSAG